MLIIFAGTIAVVLVVAVTAVAFIAIVHPELFDEAGAVQGVSNILGILVGVVVGWLLGRPRLTRP